MVKTKKIFDGLGFNHQEREKAKVNSFFPLLSLTKKMHQYKKLYLFKATVSVRGSLSWPSDGYQSCTGMSHGTTKVAEPVEDE